MDKCLTVFELHALEVQVVGQSADAKSTLLFLKDGMLAVIRAAITAEVELARRGF